MLIAGIDVGGTNIGAGLVDDGHNVLDRGKTRTPQTNPEDLVDAIVGLVQDLDEEPVGIGLGIPGVVHGTAILKVPNLAGWTGDHDVVGQIEDRLGVPVALGNDANVGLLGEWLAGAAVGHDNVLGVWMGTGIGGGLILNGRPFNGSRGSAGEIGHIITHHGGALCGCGRRGCIEAYAGRRSLAGIVSSMVDAGRETSLYNIKEEEGKVRLTSKVWARALKEGDELATELFDMAVEVTGVGVGSVVNMLDLELVVIGGGIAEKLGQDIADRIAEAAAPWMLRPNPELRFVTAALGDDSGLVGAAAIGRARLIAD